MQIRSLRFALTLAEELHFGKAAQRHYIVAQQFGLVIRDLESRLGYQIFARSSRRVSVTTEGAKFLDEAARVVRAFDDLIAAPRIDRAQSTHLSFAVLGFGIADHWADLDAALRRACPELSTSVCDVGFADQYDAVRAGHTDVGLVHQTGPVEGLDFYSIFSTPRVAVVPTRSPLADADYLSIADIEDCEFIDVDIGTTGIGDWVGEAWLSGRHGDRVRYPAAIPSAVAMTGRIGVHAAPASRFCPHPDVAFVPLDGPACDIAIAVRSDDHRELVEVVRQAATGLASSTAEG